MVSDASGSQPTSVEGLRERLPARSEVQEGLDMERNASEKVKALNAEAAGEDKDSGEQRTYGRTPDGTVFTVPHTEDMVSQLFDPTQPKNASDVAIVTVLLYLCGLLYFLPTRLRIPTFAVIFLFWRLCYNGGIGWLLHVQSNHKRLTLWAKRSDIFEKPDSGRNPYPFVYKLLKQEMRTKIPNDYDFETAPLEYNTWLLFRRVVDLILMCDFTSYCLFAIACGGRPVDEKLPMTIARWVCGIALVLFNLWVKLDAHRVVKDFAWYWGDFFYLIDQDLTFDGVFELAPHPMYSVGYAGYYGISLMAASYKVLFISIVAHAAQLIFLAVVESPHIEKTYNAPPPPAKRADISGISTPPQYQSKLLSSLSPNSPPTTSPSSTPSPVHNLVGLQNVDFFRITDVSVALLQFYMYGIAFLTPATFAWQSLFVVNAVAWRLWYSIGIGFILDRQSNKKRWTRHFVKYGESTEEAWRQWKGIYHLSMITCYTSFVCATWKMYHLPADWTYGMTTLRHVIGVAAIALQIWTVTSIYESLGEFGWFFGDFFYPDSTVSRLTYDGIYRFLNNPERTIGLAGVWGAAILTWSKAIFFLALMSHILTLCFIQFVERPHMQKLYRQSLRKTSGVSKSLKRSLPPPLQKWTGSVDRVLDETLDFVEEYIDAARPKLAAGFSSFVRDSMTLFKQYPARVTITRLAPDLAGFNPKDYSLEIDMSTPGLQLEAASASGREGEDGQVPQQRTDSFQRSTVEYGAPIRVKWTAPLNHSKKDWIGLYMVADNATREATKVSSQGRWIATNRNSFDIATADAGILMTDVLVAASHRQDGESQDFLSGIMEFSGDKLWWTSNVFEFRYHHANKHNVMAISLPFEIKISRFDEDSFDFSTSNIQSAIETEILPVVQNCFDRSPDLAPRSPSDLFGPTLEREGKYAKRVVYAIQRMFGVEFAPEVVAADGSVRNLAWRICEARRVLAPYSMSRSKGGGTPEEK
ncbi:phosphatidylethanolamine N-methyltransferase [Oleoguttula sp. CCFEE 5521]